MKYLLRIARESDPAPVEALQCALSLTYGVWLVLSSETFKTAPGLYRYLAHIAPSWAWGALFFAAGMLRLVALSSGSIRLRLAASWTGALLWAAIVAFFVAGDRRALGGPVVTIFALACSWCAARLSGDGRRLRTSAAHDAEIDAKTARLAEEVAALSPASSETFNETSDESGNG